MPRRERHPKDQVRPKPVRAETPIPSSRSMPARRETIRANVSANEESNESRDQRCERMFLVGADREVFLAAVRRPLAPSERLIKALQRNRELIRNDGSPP